MARARSKLTEKQAAFINAKMDGANNAAAIHIAGLSAVPTAEVVRTQLAAARRWLTDTTQIRRLDVIEGIIDSIEMGRMMSDPAAVRMGWVEIGKILGHYAPEVKKIELTVNQGRLRAKFEALSDEDLLAIAEGRVIDGVLSEEALSNE